MKLSKHLLTSILSYFPFLKKLQTVQINKSLQQLLDINLSYYIFLHRINNYLPKHNMFYYYDSCLNLFPSVQKEIKSLLLSSIITYSSTHDIEIDNIHPFSYEILKKVPQNIILDIKSIEKHNNDIYVRDNTNIKQVNIYVKRDEYNKSYKKLINYIIPVNITKLIVYTDFKKENEVNIKDYSIFQKLKYLSFINAPLNNESINEMKAFFPNITNLYINEIKIRNVNQENGVFFYNYIYNLNKFDNLTELIVKGNSIENSSVKYPQKIKVLSIDFCTEYIKQFKRLRVLTINNETNLTVISELLENLIKIKEFNLQLRLKEKEIEEKSLIAFIKQVKQLKKLRKFSFSIYSKCGINAQLQSIIQHFRVRSLRALYLNVSSYFDIIKIIKMHPHLTSLSIDNAYSILCELSEIENLNLDRLKEISIHMDNLYLNSDNVIKLITQCRNLQKISLNMLTLSQNVMMIEKINKFQALKEFSLKSNCDYILKEEDIDRICQCFFLEDVRLIFDCAGNKQRLVELMNRLFKKLPFLEVFGTIYSMEYENIKINVINKPLFNFHLHSINATCFGTINRQIKLSNSNTTY